MNVPHKRVLDPFHPFLPPNYTPRQKLSEVQGEGSAVAVLSEDAETPPATPPSRKDKKNKGDRRQSSEDDL